MAVSATVATPAATAPGRANAAPPAAHPPRIWVAPVVASRVATAMSRPASASAVRIKAVSPGRASAAPAPTRPTSPAAAVCVIASRSVRADSPVAPIATATATSSHGVVLQLSPSDAGVARPAIATPATAPSRRTGGGSAR